VLSQLRRDHVANSSQTFRHASRPARPIAVCLAKAHPRCLTPSQLRLLSTETKAAIDKAVASKPVVLFMKGTPETPQCGFSRASIQILGLQGVDPNKFSAFNVLEDEELRQGMFLHLQILVAGVPDSGF
jgi:monothiol glutaredoxin